MTLKASELVQKLREWCERHKESMGDSFAVYDLLRYGESLIQAQGEVEDNWIPVSERLPEVGERCLVFLPTLAEVEKIEIAMRLNDAPNLWWKLNKGSIFIGLESATHWKPITPPRTKDKKEGEK